MKYLFLLACFLNSSYTDLYAQSSPTDFIKDIFNAIQRNDTTGFASHYLTSREQISILNRYFSIDTTTQEPGWQHNDLSGVKRRTSLLEEVLNGISALSDAVMTDYRYQIVKEPQALLPSMTGCFFFKIKSDYYSFPIGEAVWLDGKWKLSTLDRIVKVDSIDANPQRREISAFGSFKLKVEVKLVDDPLIPPPPPPPPPTPGKKGKKH